MAQGRKYGAPSEDQIHHTAISDLARQACSPLHRIEVPNIHWQIIVYSRQDLRSKTVNIFFLSISFWTVDWKLAVWNSNKKKKKMISFDCNLQMFSQPGNWNGITLHFQPIMLTIEQFSFKNVKNLVMFSNKTYTNLLKSNYFSFLK